VRHTGQDARDRSNVFAPLLRRAKAEDSFSGYSSHSFYGGVPRRTRRRDAPPQR